jgi:ATP-dependent RNA helicase RhlE
VRRGAAQWISGDSPCFPVSCAPDSPPPGTPVTVSPASSPAASFASLKLAPPLQKALAEIGFVKPTPIQAEAIPHGLAGRDVLAAAATGSGKTLAFLLPILNALLTRPRGQTRALVLAPTRELAAQILADFDEVAVHTPLSGAAIFGGVSERPQEHALRTGVDLVVATPGRLLDHMRAPYAKFAGLEFLVLDEADRMLDMGFLPDIKRVLRQLPTRRQTFFFSATLPAPIVALTRELLKDPASLNIERQSTPAAGITQAVYPVASELKSALLLKLLDGQMREALVFTRTKHRANRLAEHLVKAGIAADRIHGNRSQNQRTQALDGFKSGRVRVLVATDIAARGIDVEALGHVVNFDVPQVPEDYIHRIGRTGRAEMTGEAYTLVAPDEENELKDIERVLKKRLPRVTLPDFDYTKRPEAKLEVPLAERIAHIRARRHEERSRGQSRSQGQGGQSRGQGQGQSRGHGHGRGRPQGQRPPGRGGPRR